ncbi:MAG: hypothetical protein HY813_00060 [Candidatus Portnoybacteria bacterium]|nr:hypothetical protein [Candidatus Portnoybacteria bacterium]
MSEKPERVFVCSDCGHKWPVAAGSTCSKVCPKCGGMNIKKILPCVCESGGKCQCGGKCKGGGQGGGKQ